MTDKELVWKAYFDNVLKIAKVNLQTGEYIFLKSLPLEEEHGCMKGKTISEYQNLVIDDGSFVHPDDLNVARRYVNIDFLKKCIDNGKRIIACRLRRMVDDCYCWVTFEINISADYSEENPWVIYCWKIADSGVSSLEDATQMLANMYYRILKINLTQDTYEEIDMYAVDKRDNFKRIDKLSEMFYEFAELGYVYEEDKAQYLEFSNLENLRRQFSEGTRNLNYTYRRKVGEDFRWVSMEMIPGMEYSENNQVVMLYIRDIQEQRLELLNNYRQLEQHCNKDSLTGLYNRFYYRQLCTLYSNDIRKNPLGVVFADLNGLKYVNDNYGHYSGDTYLKAFADIIIDIFGKNVCFRISGDEFLVIMQDIAEQDFLRHAHKLEKKLKEQAVPIASIGVEYEKAPESMESVLKIAELKMYKAKQDYYKENHNFSGDSYENSNRKRDMVIEQIVSKEVMQNKLGKTDDGGRELDKTGLSSRIFDVFAATAKRNILFLCNLKTNVSRWSKSCVEYFGLPGEYMYNVPEIWEKHIHPDDLEEYRDQYNKLINGELSNGHFEYRALNKANEYVICTCQCTVLRGEGDEPDFLSGTIINHGIRDSIDTVTNLHNKKGFLKRIEELSAKGGQSVAIMFIIDAFSSINMFYGYSHGEAVLKKFAEQLRDIVGVYGTVYYLESAGFGICLNNADENFAKKIYGQIQNIGCTGIRMDNFLTTLKVVGGAVLLGDYSLSAGEIVSNLSYALGASKRKYRGELIFYKDVVKNKDRRERELIGKIYQSVMNDCEGFYLRYQPIADANTGEIIGMEALVRWRSEMYGEVSPDRFIQWLEESPCVFEFGNWVIRQALLDACKIKKYKPDFFVNVNIAATQLERREFRETVIQILKEMNYPPEHFCMELTERCKDLDLDFLREQIEYFRSYGINIAMDDFGTGNVSLGAILELPIDEIKVDRSFIMDIENKHSNQVLVKSIVQCAEDMNIKICLEGVETRQLVNYLKRYNANYYQGYHYAKPLLIDEFTQYLHNS